MSVNFEKEFISTGFRKVTGSNWMCPRWRPMSSSGRFLAELVVVDLEKEFRLHRLFHISMDRLSDYNEVLGLESSIF